MNIELLESRVVLAMTSLAIINPHTAIYDDVDGDRVTVKVSTGTLTPGLFIGDPSGIGDQLRKLDLSGGGFDGASLTITATTHHGNGDGLVNVGFIDSSSHDLGAVKVWGDLDEILAGSGTDPTHGLVSLSVFSLGRFSTSIGATDMFVHVNGKLGALKVKGDMRETFVMAGSIGSVSIGGSVFGTSVDNSGSIIADGDIGKVKIGRDLDRGDNSFHGIIRSTNGSLGGVVIGGSVVSGVIISSAGNLGPVKIAGTGAHPFITSTAGKIAGVTVGGPVFQGGLVAAGDVGLVKIGGAASRFPVTSNTGNVAGVMIGGEVFESDVTSHGDIGFVKIGGGVLINTISSTDGSIGPVAVGGDATSFDVTSVNGRIASVTVSGNETGNGEVTCKGDLGPVKIGGDAVGTHIESTAGKVLGVKIGGSLEGNTVSKSGTISSFGDMGMIRIGGDLMGGVGTFSGRVFSGGKLAGISVGGSVLGASSGTANTGEIFSTLEMGSVTIGGDVSGTGAETGLIHTGSGKIESVTIGGSLSGGTGDNSGIISTTGSMGPVKIGAGIFGNSGSFSAMIEGGSIASVTIGGSLFGGSGAGSFKGVISSSGSIGPVKIGGDLQGGGLFNVDDNGLDASGYIQGGRIKSVFIGGSIVTGDDHSDQGTLSKNASIRATNDIGSITVKNNVIGTPDSDSDPSDGDFTPVIITARGVPDLAAKTDVAIGKITVGGRISRANILAGYDVDAATGLNADAQIGAVTVGGEWIATNLIAGVMDAFGGFGGGDDAAITGGKNIAGAISKIASVIIKGTALGTLDTGDIEHFGIEAQQIGYIKLGGGFAEPLKNGPANDLFGSRDPLGATLDAVGGFDFSAFEVPLV